MTISVESYAYTYVVYNEKFCPSQFNIKVNYAFSYQDITYPKGSFERCSITPFFVTINSDIGEAVKSMIKHAYTPQLTSNRELWVHREKVIPGRFHISQISSQYTFFLSIESLVSFIEEMLIMQVHDH